MSEVPAQRVLTCKAAGMFVGVVRSSSLLGSCED